MTIDIRNAQGFVEDAMTRLSASESGAVITDLLPGQACAVEIRHGLQDVSLHWEPEPCETRPLLASDTPQGCFPAFDIPPCYNLQDEGDGATALARVSDDAFGMLSVGASPGSTRANGFDHHPAPGWPERRR